MNPRPLVRLLIVFFMLASAVGLWATYDLQAGMARFLLLSVSVLTFFLLELGGGRARRVAVGAMTTAGGLLSLLILLKALTTTPWTNRLLGSAPTGIPLISAVGESVPVGIIVIALPFITSGWKGGADKGHREESYLHLGLLILVGTAIVVSGSMAAVLTLSLGGIGVGLWRIGGQKLRTAAASLRDVFLVAVAGVMLAVVFLWLSRGVLERAIDQPTISGRFIVAEQAIKLIQDFPITGGGLGSISGLYAHYIRGVPVELIPHTYNLFLNLGIEVGLFGLATFLGIQLLSLGLLSHVRRAVRPISDEAYATSSATLAGLVLLLVMGLYDDPLYSSWGSLFLFVIPGIAVSMSADYGVGQNVLVGARNWESWLLLASIPLLIGLLVAARHQVASVLTSNLWAVKMAKIELEGWPTREWSDGSLASLLTQTEEGFLRARDLDPRNRTALHRLGLIAMERRDYRRAAGLLGEAHELDPNHRGIRKALGYSLAWNGEYLLASEILEGIAEAESELSIYRNWWRAQGRPDLADHAAEMRRLLGQSKP